MTLSCVLDDSLDMLSLQQALGLAFAAALLTPVPGPSVLFVVARSVSHGRRLGLYSALGNNLGLLPIVCAVAFGLGSLLNNSTILFTAVKLAGSMYLIYLGILAIRHRRVRTENDDVEADPSAARVLREGILVGVSNPKSLIFLGAALPQFVDPSRGDVPAQLFLLGLIFMLVAALSDSAYAFAAGNARRWFGESPARISRMRIGGGFAMIGLGGLLATTSLK